MLRITLVYLRIRLDDFSSLQKTAEPYRAPRYHTWSMKAELPVAGPSYSCHFSCPRGYYYAVTWVVLLSLLLQCYCVYYRTWSMKAELPVMGSSYSIDSSVFPNMSTNSCFDHTMQCTGFEGVLLSIVAGRSRVAGRKGGREEGGSGAEKLPQTRSGGGQQYIYN